jgi:hypothetical protein
MFDQSLGMAGV